jgi:predicted  nucleic acid-binding Zn-ribbon protein
MSQLLTKLSEFESQIDGELKQIDKKMKELKQQRLKLTGLQKALNPKVNKPKRIVKAEEGKPQDTKQN